MSRHCRFCQTPLTHTFADLGLSPLSNAYVKAERLNQGEVMYPLHAWVCPSCHLVQLEEFEQAHNIFNDEYAYFSSYSSSWLAHARQYSTAMTARFGLGVHSQVVEIASNDGYLLQNLSGQAFRHWESSRPPTPQKWPSARAFQRGSSSLGSKPPTPWLKQAMRLTFCLATTCWHTSPTLTTLSVV